MPHVLDRAEFGRLFAEHARLLWVVAAASVPKSAVEDVLQDAAAAALSRLDDFTPDTNFRAWMTQIVRYTAANARRRARRDVGLDGVDEPARQPERNPVVARNGQLRDGQSEFDDQVLHALQGLPDDARTSLLLRVVLDLSLRDIAATLALPEGTVASHVHRARQALRESLAARAPAATNGTTRGTPVRDTASGGRP